MTSRRRTRAVALVGLLALTAAACSDDAAGPGTGPDRAASSTTTASGSSGGQEGPTDDDAGSEGRSVPLDGRPSAVAAAGGALFVAEDLAGAVLQLDASSGAVGASVTVGGAPVAVAASGESLWVVSAEGSASRFDLPLAADAAPTARVEPGGALVDVLVLDGVAWVGDIEGGVVHALDERTGRPVRPALSVPGGVVRLAVAGGRLWVSGLSDQVTPIDPSTGAVAPSVRVGVAPIGMAAVGGALWVADSESGTVTRLDASSGAPVGDPVSTGAAPIALAAEGEDVWVLEQDAATLSRLDAATGEPIGIPVDLPMRPRGLALTEAGVWVVGVEPSVAVLVPR